MARSSGFPDTDFPAPGIHTIPLAAIWAGHRYGSMDALKDGPRRITFAEYMERAKSIAKALMASGVEIGDRVAVWAPNSIDFALVALGIHCAGGILIPINTRFVPAEVDRLSQEVQPKIVFTVESFLNRDFAAVLDALYTDRPTGPRIIVIDSPDRRSLHSFVTAGTEIGDAALSLRMKQVTPDDIATVLFTSGTTGRAKGAMLRHGAIVRAYWTFSGAVGMRQGDRYLCTNPMFHAFGLMAGVLSALLRGMTLYPVAVYDPRVVVELIEHEGITYFPGPPTVFQGLLSYPDLPNRDISTLRASVVGATALPPSIIRDMYSELGFDEIHVPYGFTEVTAVATVTLASDSRATIEKTAGVPLPGVDVKVVRPDGTQADIGETGEIVVDGYNRMAGYLNARENQPDEGPLHSGDLGSFDAQGYLTVRGRIKDMYIAGGFNVYPAEVEAELMEMPGVEQVAIIGVPDDRLGEVGCAFVIRRGAATITEHDVITWCRERVANFKVPRSVIFPTALPMNATGKVLKTELHEMYRTARNRAD